MLEILGVAFGFLCVGVLLTLVLCLLVGPYNIASRRARRARAGTIAGAAERRFVVAVGTLTPAQALAWIGWFCLAAGPREPGLLFTAFALALRIPFVIADLVALRRLRRLMALPGPWRAAGDDVTLPRPAIDAGIGDRLAVVWSGDETYRAAPTITQAVRGDPSAAYHLVRRCFREHLVLFAVVTGLPACAAIGSWLAQPR